MAVLLIIGLLTVGFSTLSADDSLESDTQNVDASSDADTTAESVANTTDMATADDNGEDNQTAQEATNSTDSSTNDTNVTSSQLMDDDAYSSLADYIDNLNDYNYVYVIDSLEALNDDAFDNLLNVLMYPEEYDTDAFIAALKDLDRDHLVTLIRIVNSIDDSSVSDYVLPSQNNVKENHAKIISSDKIRNSGNSNVQVFKQSSIKSNNYYNDVFDQLSDYEIYQIFLNAYLNGTITFDQLIVSLEANGINTDDLILNDDGSITFFGQTSDVPNSTESSDDDNTTLNNTTDTNTTDDSNSTDTNTTDNTDTTDSTENTATDESSQSSNDELSE